MLDEQWKAQAVAAVRRSRETDPQGWADYLSDAEEIAASEASVLDGWRA